MADSSPPLEQLPPPAEAEAEAEAEAAIVTPRRTRLPRACNSRPKAPPPAPPPRPERPRRVEWEGEEETAQYRVVTPLVVEPEAAAELPRWRLRGMWELASVLNFIHVFRPLLKIVVEFTAEELEDAIITPNNTLDDVHMPLLRSIPPVTRMAMGRATWVTVLCRKLKDWWHWVAEGDIPIAASHGAETEMYKALEPATRLVILKAICDIRVEQEDVRDFIDSSLKRGYHISIYRKERIGGDSYGISYWYEEDPILGHRLYREIRLVDNVEEPAKRSKRKGFSSVPVVSYQWETVASNFNEFEAAAEKLFSSRNRTEVSLGKKLKIHYLPEIEKIHKKKERQQKKQQREALLLESFLTVNGFTSGRSRRERKRITYTFDDYERSINEAIKTIIKNENSAVVSANTSRRVLYPSREASNNGRLSGPSPVCNGFHEDPPKFCSYQASDGEEKAVTLHRSFRQRKRSQRYTQDFVEAVSDIDLDFNSDDDIMGEAVYDEDYLRSRKQRKTSPSEDDEEFRLEQVAVNDAGLSSEDEKELRRYKRLPARSPEGIKLRTVDEIQIGIRRSKRSTRPRIYYQRYDVSGMDTELRKPGKLNATDPDVGSNAVTHMEISTGQGHEEEKDGVNEERLRLCIENGRENRSLGRKFLDLNELAPVGVFDDVPVLMVKDKHMNNS